MNGQYAIAVHNMIKTTDSLEQAKHWLMQYGSAATLYVRLEDAVAGALEILQQAQQALDTAVARHTTEHQALLIVRDSAAWRWDELTEVERRQRQAADLDRTKEQP